MSDPLSMLAEVQGVLGFALFDPQGQCVAHQLPAPHEPILIEDVTRKVAAAFEVFGSLGHGQVDDFCLRCDGGGLIVRHCSEHVVVVLTRPDVNPNFLHVALNVVTLHLSRGGSGGAMQQSVGLGMSGSTFGSRHGGMLSGSTGAAAVAIPPDAVGRTAVLQLFSVFQHYVGPVAKPLFKQQLADLGVTSRTLRNAQWQDLIRKLASRIPSNERQAQFMDSADRVRAEMQA